MNHWYFEFWEKYRKIIILHVFITVIIPPIEILILTIYTKKLFQCLRDNNFDLFVKLFIGFIVCLFLLQILYGWKEYIDNQITPRVQSFVRNKCMYKYISQTRDSFRTINVMNTITTLPKYFYQNYESFMKFWIPFISCFFFYTIFLFWVNIRVGILSTVVFTALIFTFFVCYRKLSSYSNRVFQSQDELLFGYENVLLNNETIQSYNRQEKELNQLQANEQEFESRRVRLVFYIDVVKFSFIIILFLYLLSVFSFAYNRMKVAPLQMPTWKFISFVTVLFFVVRYIILLMNQFRNIVQVKGMLYSTRNINVIPSKQANPLEFKNYDLEMKDVVFSYPTNPSHKVVENFNFFVPEKTSVYVKGDIGSGKSTIGKLISRMYDPNAGMITIGGHNIKDIPDNQFKSLMFLMNQNTMLFSGKTVFENICYAFERLPPKSILDQYKLPETFLKVLDKRVIENGVNISGGQKRLVYIIRALLHEAPIVILDEPTDSLDKTSAEYMYNAIVTLQKMKTVICISHDATLENFFPKSFSVS